MRHLFRGIGTASRDCRPVEIDAGANDQLIVMHDMRACEQNAAAIQIQRRHLGTDNPDTHRRQPTVVELERCIRPPSRQCLIALEARVITRILVNQRDIPRQAKIAQLPGDRDAGHARAKDDDTRGAGSGCPPVEQQARRKRAQPGEYRATRRRTGHRCAPR
ncbi:hypothetical protein WL25_23575 [Burkholderia ubonensis]|nr:hypothetical protein WL25_23575 [Burkholderia ubonensis]